MFGLFKKKEITEEEAQKRIEEMEAEIKGALAKKQEKEEREKRLMVNEIKRLLGEADDDILESIFNQAAYVYLVCGIDGRMSSLYGKPTLSFTEINLFSSTVKYMFDLYLDWKKEYNIFLNKCIMEAIKQIRKERENKNESTENETSGS